MPIMGRIDASSTLIKMSCKTPIVALTANIMATDCEAYKQFGMEECIGKPFTLQELWWCLLKYLEPVSWKALSPTPTKLYTTQKPLAEIMFALSQRCCNIPPKAVNSDFFCGGK